MLDGLWGLDAWDREGWMTDVDLASPGSLQIMVITPFHLELPHLQVIRS